LGRLAFLRNDQDRAAHLWEASLRSAHSCGDQAISGWALVGLGDVALCRGSYEEAIEHFERARTQFEKLDQKIDLALALQRLASVFAGRGEYSRANALSFQSLALYREVGYTTGVFQVLVLFARQDLERQEFERGVKLLAGVHELANRSGGEPSLITQIQDIVSGAQSQCRQDRFNLLWRVGKTLSIDELVQIARERDAPVTLELVRQAEQ
jgi:tetratricopeptide (TPR) repeat protein